MDPVKTMMHHFLISANSREVMYLLTHISGSSIGVEEGQLLEKNKLTICIMPTAEAEQLEKRISNCESETDKVKMMEKQIEKLQQTVDKLTMAKQN